MRKRSGIIVMDSWAGQASLVDRPAGVSADLRRATGKLAMALEMSR